MGREAEGAGRVCRGRDLHRPRRRDRRGRDAQEGRPVAQHDDADGPRHGGGRIQTCRDQVDTLQKAAGDARRGRTDRSAGDKEDQEEPGRSQPEEPGRSQPEEPGRSQPEAVCAPAGIVEVS